MTTRTHLIPCSEKQKESMRLRTLAESSLGMAADALERTADFLQRLDEHDGFTYPPYDGGAVLPLTQTLSEQALKMQMHLRTENHQ